MRKENCDTFVRKLYDRKGKAVSPGEVIWELTRQCNLRCGHCYLPEDQLRRKDGTLSLPEIKRIISQLSRVSCLQLTFTGGEVFTRPDLFDVLAFAKQKGFLISILTNGTLINEKNIRRLSGLGSILFIKVTLNTLMEKTSRIMTGRNGALARTLNAVRLLKANNVPFCVNTLVTRQNFRELAALERFCKGLKVRHEKDYFLHPRQGRPAAKNASQITESQMRQRIARDFPLAGDKECGMDVSARRLKSGRALYCGAGTATMYISWRGKAGLCIDFPLPEADVLKPGVASAWKRVRRFAKSLKAPPEFACSSCERINECSWCPALGWIYHRDPFACVDFYKRAAEIVSQVIKNRAKNG